MQFCGYLLPVGVAAAAILLCSTYACNEGLCGPLVSKCMLLKCCECNMSDKKNCTCCRACQVCLAKLYTECCSCVGLCPVPDPEDTLQKSSSIENLPDPIPELFDVLTEEEDFLQRWTTFHYSYSLNQLLFHPGTGYIPELTSAVVGEEFSHETGGGVTSQAIMGLKNCSTAFFSQCMSIRKCKVSCKSMGAARYRWFHEYGCCQCVGSTCIDYGLSEPRCLRCPADDDYGGGERVVEEEGWVKSLIDHQLKATGDKPVRMVLSEGTPDTG